jgi:hypothetical protein
MSVPGTREQLAPARITQACGGFGRANDVGEHHSGEHAIKHRFVPHASRAEWIEQRDDKPLHEADTLDTLRALIRQPR